MAHPGSLCLCLCFNVSHPNPILYCIHAEVFFRLLSKSGYALYTFRRGFTVCYRLRADTPLAGHPPCQKQCPQKQSLIRICRLWNPGPNQCFECPPSAWLFNLPARQFQFYSACYFCRGSFSTRSAGYGATDPKKPDLLAFNCMFNLYIRPYHYCSK